MYPRRYFRCIGVFLFILALTYGAWADPQVTDEIDIPEDWQGAAVSAQFGSLDPQIDYDGNLETYSGDINYGAGTTASGSCSGDVTGPGTGQIRTSAAVFHHIRSDESTDTNLGTSAQTLKPFVVQGTGTISTSVRVDFDGLLVVDEGTANADDWVKAQVEYLAEIQQFDSATGHRAVVGSNTFDGVAWVTQTGAGTNSIVIPETYTWMEEEGAQPNSWHNNSGLSIRKIVNGVAGDGEISISALPADTQGTATTYVVTEGRTAYYLVYGETFTFDAQGGQTYYIYMDLLTSAASTTDPVSGDPWVSTYARSDFSHTIDFTLSAGGASLTTPLLLTTANTVSGNNPFGGGSSNVTLSAATLNVTADASLAESFALNAGTSNTVNVAAGQTGSFTGGITGTGALVKNGTGIMAVSGSNDWSGGTTVNAGTLRVDADNALPVAGNVAVGAGATLDINDRAQTLNSVTGTGTVALGSGTLTIDSSSNNTFAGAFSETGDVIKQGTGALTLSGNSTATGDLSVNGGSAAVNGTWSGNTVVGTAGTLKGTGTISGNVTLNGRAAPGNSIGTQNIGGNFIQNAGSVLEIEFDNAGNADLLNITGSAQINAGSILQPLATETITADRTVTFIQTAGGITGTYTLLDNYGLIDFSAAVTGNDYQLTIDRLSYREGGRNDNQQSLGQALDILDATAAGDTRTMLDALVLLDPAALERAYSSLSPIMTANTALIEQSNSRLFTGLIRERLSSYEEGAPKAYAQAIAGVGSIDNDGGSTGGDWFVDGFMTGLETTLAGDLVAGIGGGGFWTDIDGNDTVGSADISSFKTALYAGYPADDFTAWLILGYGRSENDINRNISYLNRTAKASPASDVFSASLGCGSAIAGENITLRPAGYLEYLSVHEDSYAESGGGAAALQVDANTTDSLRSGLGASAQWNVSVNDWTAGMSLRLIWEHEFMDTSVVRDASVGGQGFRTESVDMGRDSILTGLGLTWRYSDSVNVKTAVDGRLSSQATECRFSGELEYRF